MRVLGDILFSDNFCTSSLCFRGDTLYSDNFCVFSICVLGVIHRLVTTVAHQVYVFNFFWVVRYVVTTSTHAKCIFG